MGMTGDAPAAYAAAERLGAGRDDNGGSGGLAEHAADAGGERGVQGDVEVPGFNPVARWRW